MKKIYFIKSIGIILLIIILASVDLTEVMQRLKQCNSVMVALAIVLILPQVALRAYRWKGLLALQAIQCSWRNALLFYFASIFVGLVTPGRLGELARGVFLKQHGLSSIGYSLPSVLADRLFDLFVITVLALLALPYFNLCPHAGIVSAFMITMMIVFAGVGIKWLGASERLIFLAEKFKARLGNNWSGTLDDFVKGVRSLISAKLLIALLLTVMSYALYFVQTYLIGRAIGLPLGYVEIAMVVATGILVGYVPVTVAGLGTREAVLIFLFARFGIPAASALSFAFLYNLVYIVCVGMISSVLWMKLPNRPELKKIRDNKT